MLEMFEPSVVGDAELQRLIAIADQGWRRPPGQFRRRIARAVLRTLRVVLRADEAWASHE